MKTDLFQSCGHCWNMLTIQLTYFNTAERLFFPSHKTKTTTQSIPSGSLHKPFILLHQRENVYTQTENHNHRKLTNLITWTTALSNSMKLWVMLCGATQDGQVIVESSDKMWSTGEGNGKPLQYSCLENSMNSMKRQKGRTLKEEFPRSVGAQYATGDQ